MSSLQPPKALSRPKHSAARAPFLAGLHALTQPGWPRQTARLYFNRRSCASIRYCRMSVSSRRNTPHRTVILACFNHDETDLKRRSLFYPPENRLHVMDLPGLYSLHTLLKLYTPPDPNRDPFLVAIIIALAQEERRHAPQPKSHPASFTVGRRLFRLFLAVPSHSTTTESGIQITDQP